MILRDSHTSPWNLTRSDRRWRFESGHTGSKILIKRALFSAKKLNFRIKAPNFRKRAKHFHQHLHLHLQWSLRRSKQRWRFESGHIGSEMLFCVAAFPMASCVTARGQCVVVCCSVLVICMTLLDHTQSVIIYVYNKCSYLSRYLCIPTEKLPEDGFWTPMPLFCLICNIISNKTCILD